MYNFITVDSGGDLSSLKDLQELKLNKSVNSEGETNWKSI